MRSNKSDKSNSRSGGQMTQLFHQSVIKLCKLLRHIPIASLRRTGRICFTLKGLIQSRVREQLFIGYDRLNTTQYCSIISMKNIVTTTKYRKNKHFFLNKTFCWKQMVVRNHEKILCVGSKVTCTPHLNSAFNVTKH